jgi:NCS1 family nucleobase:cation symporter-1
MGHAWRILASFESHHDWVHLGTYYTPTYQRLIDTNVFKMGIQTYWGGQAVKIVLSAVIGPKYANMKNTLPLSANVDTCSLVSFFLFLAIILPMFFIPPEKLQTPLRVGYNRNLYLLISSLTDRTQIAFVMIVCNIFGMLIWSVRTAHGAGTLIHTGSSETGSAFSWNVVYGIQIILGFWSGGIVGQSGKL